jgi:hypothetical protein
MSDFATLKSTLKRGVLVTAANWPVVLIQFATESTFKLLVGVPVVGGALLVAIALGRDLRDLLTGDTRDIATTVVSMLVQQPAALLAFLAALGLALAGGGALSWAVKGGTVTVLVAGERGAGDLERVPGRVSSLSRAAAYSIETYLDGCQKLFRRYLRLGLALYAVYLLSGGLYLIVVIGGYGALADTGFALGWTMVAATCSAVLVLWITVVNLLYLLLQMTIALEDCSVRQAVRLVVGFLENRGRDVGVVFVLVFGLVVVATGISIVTTAGLGLLSFVPLVGLAVFPLQAVAWLVRGLVFQYLGLTALGTYLSIYRTSVVSARELAGARLRTVP